MFRQGFLRCYQRISTALDLLLTPCFSNRPRNLRIQRPHQIVNSENIWIGDDVRLGRNSVLIAYKTFSSPLAKQDFKPRITIGNRVGATGLQIHAVQEITIENDVVFANNVFLADSFHGYTNAHQPYKDQPLFRIAPVFVKQGCWLGQNVVICPGVTIGEFSIIGANSVVTSDIPSRSIAVGSPARVIKTWDETDQKWMPIVPADVVKM